MNKELIIQIIRFVVLVLLQGLVFINIELFDGRMHVYCYILFVLLLPFRTSPMLTMGLAFLLGLSVDMFYNSIGVHASASVFIGFIRERVLELLAPRDGYDIKDSPTLGSLGLVWFLQYAFILVLLHHLWLFVIEAFTFQGIFSTLGKAILSTLLTFVILLLGQFLFHGRRRSTV